MSWKEIEQKSFEWFKSNYDPNATAQGQEDSIHSDIYSPKFSCYIEVKDLPSRCGQFTESTIGNNPFAEAIKNGDTSKCQDFVRFHYKTKQVKYFIVDYHLYSMEDFLSTFNFSIQKPYNKRSGTRSAPKKDFPILIEQGFIQRNNKIYCNDHSRWGTYLPNSYFISKTTGELRKQSSTNNTTWHILIERTSNDNY